MKKTLYTTLIILFFSIKLFAAADLVVATSGAAPTSVDSGEILVIQGSIKNIGNSTAAANYMFIYMSSDQTFEETEIIGRISVKQLTAGQTQNFVAGYSVPISVKKGSYYVGYRVDAYDVVTENDEKNDFINTTKISVSDFYKEDLRIPCPIIFVHGWTSYSTTWRDFTTRIDSMQGLIFGGRLDYCLNPDGDKYVSDNYSLSFVNKDALTKGDYYCLNFDVSRNGTPFVGNDGVPFNDDYSNQSAITKQGWAVREAIKTVLETTGAENVILVGHSMGGLASREYLQNTKNYQPDGKHHVAKLVTIGTPNQGSNTNLTTGVNILGTLVGLDSYSEAVRDLRYKSTKYSGLYLDGGVESPLTLFNNDDVNCNGYVGDNITGLNQRVTPSNLDYSCIVSDWILDTDLDGGDGVVAIKRADINNIILPQPPLKKEVYDKYTTTSFHTSIHKDVKNFGIVTRSLDEPYLYNLAYTIPLNTLWFGIVSEQAANNPLPAPDNTIDYDDYKIKITQAGDLTIGVYNIPVNTFTAYLVDATYKTIKEIKSNGEASFAFSTAVQPGDYYIEFGAIPTPNSWAFHYTFDVNFKPTSKLQASFITNKTEGCATLAVNFVNKSQGTPSSFKWDFPGGTPSTSTLENPTIGYAKAGVYPVSFTVTNSSDSHTITKNAFVKVNGVPTTDFSFALLAKDTVKFINKTNTAGLTTTYSWTFGDNTTSTEFAPTHKYTKNGTYTAKLTAQNTCGSTSKSQTFTTKTTSTTQVNSNGFVKIIPNPNSGIFTLQIQNTYFGICKIQIVNELGQVVFQNNLDKTNEEISYDVDLSAFSNGNYAVVISSKDDIFTNKFIIQK